MSLVTRDGGIDGLAGDRYSIRLDRFGLTNNTSHVLPLTKEEATMMSSSREAARYGITFGTALAIAISWSVNKSVLWAILHGFLSWFYVVWHVVIT
jgi:hypothetical protein